MDIAACTELARRCRAVAEEIEDGELLGIVERINDAVRIIQRSFCGSWIGYHAHVYYLDFQPPPPGHHFSAEWGFQNAFSNPTSPNWQEVTLEAVEAEVQRLTGGTDISPLRKRSKEVIRQFKQEQSQLVSLLNAALEETRLGNIEELRDNAKSLKPFFPSDDIAESYMPKSVWSRDSLAMAQGVLTPYHVHIFSQCASLGSPFLQTGELATIAETASNLLRQKFVQAKVGMLAGGTVFIGHGRSEDWRQLGTFL